MKHFFVLGTTLLVVLSTIGTVGAQDSTEDDPGLPELIQEFSLTESVFVQEQGSTQITLGMQRIRADNERSREAMLKLEYGLTNRLQIEAEVPYTWLHPTSSQRERGLGDAVIGMAYLLRPGGRGKTAVAIGLELGLRTGNQNKGLGSGRSTLATHVVLARPVGRTQLHLSLEAEVGDGAPEFAAGLAAVYPVTRTVFSTLELNGFRSSEGSRLYLTPGVVVRLRSNMELGFGYPFGLRTSGVRQGPVGKFTVEF